MQTLSHELSETLGRGDDEGVVETISDADMHRKFNAIVEGVGGIAALNEAGAHLEAPLQSTAVTIPSVVDSEGCPFPPMPPGCNVSF